MKQRTILSESNRYVRQMHKLSLAFNWHDSATSRLKGRLRIVAWLPPNWVLESRSTCHASRCQVPLVYTVKAAKSRTCRDFSPLLHIWVTFSVKWNTSTAPRSEDTIAKKHRMTAATIVDDKERSFQKVGHVTGFPLRSSDCLFWYKIEYTVYTLFILRTLPIMNHVQYISRSSR